MGWSMGFKGFQKILVIGFLVWGSTGGLAGGTTTQTQCLKHTISFSQNADQYQWTMEWNSNKPFSLYEKYFSESAGEVLEKNSEVVQNMWWKPRSPTQGDLESWIMVDSGFSKAKKYFLRNCKLDSTSVFCQLNTTAGGAGERIRWAWSKVSCNKNNAPGQAQSTKCMYQEAGSVKSAAPFASAETISIAVNTQSMKDAIRLAIAAEYGPTAVKDGFLLSRTTADDFWNQGQAKLRQGQSAFKISSTQPCR
jgi:hypothetical protein